MAWDGAGRRRVGLIPTCHTSPLLGTRLGLGAACAAIGRMTLRRTHSRPDNCNTKVIVKGNNTEQNGMHVRTVRICCGCPCIDESIIGFKGRLVFNQHMPKKMQKWGMKAFVLADSTTGHMYKWHLYTGKYVYCKYTSILPVQ